MNETLLNTIVDKVDAHERKINDLHQIAAQTAGNANTLNLIHTSIDEIKACIQQVSFPENKIEQLLKALDANLQRLKQPAQQKVIHHHHATKFVWLTATLFLIVCLLASGWYMTANKVDQYKSNDTKYRYLKLQENITLEKWCGLVDSIHINNANLRDVVLAKEEEQRRDLVILQRAMQMEKEAKELKRRVKKNNNNEQK